MEGDEAIIYMAVLSKAAVALVLAICGGSPFGPSYPVWRENQGGGQGEEGKEAEKHCDFCTDAQVYCCTDVLKPLISPYLANVLSLSRGGWIQA